jgi:hypothetical protein
MSHARVLSSVDHLAACMGDLATRRELWKSRMSCELGAPNEAEPSINQRKIRRLNVCIGEIEQLTGENTLRPLSSGFYK